MRSRNLLFTLTLAATISGNGILHAQDIRGISEENNLPARRGRGGIHSIGNQRRGDFQWNGGEHLPSGHSRL